MIWALLSELASAIEKLLRPRSRRRVVVVHAIVVPTIRNGDLARAMKTAENLARARHTPSKWIN